MLLLSTPMILSVLSASDFPFFSSFSKLEKEDGNRPMPNENISKITKDMIFTSELDSERTLREFIWIDHM